jgi:lipopolysaccharide export system protein LptC
MTSRPTAWLPIGLLLMLAGLTAWLNNAVQDVGPRNDGSKRHDPDMRVENFIARQFGIDGKVRYTLAARKMVHYPDDDSSHLTAPNFQSFEQDAPPVTITADTATTTRKGDEVFLHGNVLMVREATANSSRLTLSTSYMHVVPDNGTADTNQPVVIRDDTSVVNAASMVANNKLQTLILSKVKATYVQKKS